MLKLLITGGAGFIGCNLVRYVLQETEHAVLNYDKLTYAGNLESLQDIARHPRYEFVRGDIAEGGLLQATLQRYQPDAIMHLAAESHVDRSIDGPGEFIQTNVVGTYTLLQAARGYLQTLPAAARERFRFLHVSTDEVYGSLQSADPPFCEQTAYDPHSPYSASKAASDHLARAWYSTFGLPVVVTNCSNNYGPYQFPEKLIPVVLLKALRGEPIPVYGRGENVRDWLYVRDHARALLTVVERGQPGETYTIGGNNERRNIDLVRLLCGILDDLLPPNSNGHLRKNSERISSYEQLITFVADRPGHDLRYAIDASKIRRELAWQPQENAESGFRRTVQWYLDHAPWWQRILSGAYQMERLGQA